MINIDNYMEIDYPIDNNMEEYEDDMRSIGIPLYTSNTFYSDFICQNTNYINIRYKLLWCNLCII